MTKKTTIAILAVLILLFALPAHAGIITTVSAAGGRATCTIYSYPKEKRGFIPNPKGEEWKSFEIRTELWIKESGKLNRTTKDLRKYKCELAESSGSMATFNCRAQYGSHTIVYKLKANPTGEERAICLQAFKKLCNEVESHYCYK